MMSSMVGKWVVRLLLCLLVHFIDGAQAGRSTSSARSRSRKPTSSHTPCNGVPTVSANRRACNLFIWDAPSALFYRWCHHLLKDNIYEGRGGQKVCYVHSSFLDATRVLFNSLVHFFLDLVCTLRVQFYSPATLSLQSIQSQPMSSLWRQLSRSLGVVVVQAHVHSLRSSLGQDVQ
jgi:hypothetical protein